MKRILCFGLTASLMLLAGGCKSKSSGSVGDVSTAATGSAEYAAAPAPATTGAVAGAVTFSGAPPERVRIDMSQDPACTFAGDNYAEQVVADHGKLANVFVYVKGAPRLQPAAAPVVVDQKGCRFLPHVVAVAAGGSIEFRNSDATMHNIHTMPVKVGNRSVDVSQGPGAKPERVLFKDPENMLPVRCNNHPWMNAFINVSPNTFFSVTGTDGRFQIAGLPQGSYTLVFVHEKLGQREIPITVQAQQSTPATVAF